VKVKRALISVFNKAGLEEFARALADMGVEIISTGGTARLLGDQGISVTEVSDVTQFPEMLGGRVKTMHPRIQGGILARRDDPEHMSTIAEHGIEPIDMVVVSLYPFEEVSSQRGTPEEAVIEMIDIGGPTMIRAAAKNHESVAVITEPDDYPAVLDELRSNGGELSLATCRHLATKAFHRTAHYDFVIANWFSAYYAESGARRHLLSRVTQLHGKKLSFNNLYDLHAARSLASEFALPACVIIKHNNPCGSALAETLERAYLKALECDPVSAFGSVIAVNRPVDLATAQRMSELFIEVLFAPSYDDDALELLSRKADIRILVDNERRKFSPGEMDYKRVLGGLLVQDRDADLEDRESMEVVSERHPTETEWGDLIFASRVAKHVKSNAIVIAKNLASLGVGAGQMSRVDSTRLAIEKSHGDLQGAVVGSDAFFPFPDAVELAIDNGVTAFMQPGGSKRDDLSVKMCDARGAAMVFSRRRHFLH